MQAAVHRTRGSQNGEVGGSGPNTQRGLGVHRVNGWAGLKADGVAPNSSDAAVGSTTR